MKVWYIWGLKLLKKLLRWSRNYLQKKMKQEFKEHSWWMQHKYVQYSSIVKFYYPSKTILLSEIQCELTMFLPPISSIFLICLTEVLIQTIDRSRKRKLQPWRQFLWMNSNVYKPVTFHLDFSFYFFSSQFFWDFVICLN